MNINLVARQLALDALLYYPSQAFSWCGMQGVARCLAVSQSCAFPLIAMATPFVRLLPGK